MIVKNRQHGTAIGQYMGQRGTADERFLARRPRLQNPSQRDAGEAEGDRHAVGVRSVAGTDHPGDDTDRECEERRQREWRRRRRLDRAERCGDNPADSDVNEWRHAPR